MLLRTLADEPVLVNATEEVVLIRSMDLFLIQSSLEDRSII
jgi:hypothetical protein